MKALRVLMRLASLALVISVVAVAQEEKPFNLISVATSDVPMVAFRKMGRLLVAEGFELQSTEPTLMMITTKVTEKKYGFLSVGRIALRFSVTIDEKDSGSVATIMGKFLADAEAFRRMMKQMSGLDANTKFDADALQVEEKGMSGSPARASWNAMKELAEKYDNGKVTFHTRTE